MDASVAVKWFVTVPGHAEAGWLGQGYSGDDWSEILRRAGDYRTDDPGKHLDYLISEISPIEAGLARCEAQRFGSADAQDKV